MTHQYDINGMTCDNCVAKVKSALLMLPDVLTADVTRVPGKATVEMSQHIPTATLQQAISPDGKYTIAESRDAPAAMRMPSATASWLTTYKPLLLIFAFITAVSLITAHRNHTIDGLEAMYNFMAGFFLVFSFFKLLDLKGFAESYAMYDLLAMKAKAYGFVYPFIELVLGLAYLTRFNPTFTNAATIAVMGFSSIGVISSVLNKQKIKCACLGAVFNLPMSL